MKFKQLREGFDYNQEAINDATKLIDGISDFIDNLDVYKHADECIDSEDVATLGAAIEVLTSFRIAYEAIATKSLKDYYNKG